MIYYALAGLDIPADKFEYAKKFRYVKVFILDPLDFYEHDDLRQESEEEQKRIHNGIVRMYNKLGYGVVRVAFMSVEERVGFIKGFL